MMGLVFRLVGMVLMSIALLIHGDMIDGDAAFVMATAAAAYARAACEPTKVMQTDSAAPKPRAKDAK